MVEIESNKEVQGIKELIRTNLAIFSISLDFELHWGGFEKWPLDQYRNYFLKTREVIPTILASFERYEVHTTWATVGLLLHRNREELHSIFPKEKPTYHQIALGASNYISQNQVGKNETDDPFHYAPLLIQEILITKGQELASHSYGHYYCNEPGQNPQQFKADALAWNRAAESYGIKAGSLVFPRNQFNRDYLKVCNEVGIKIIRTNPVDWWWQIDSTQNESKWKRLNRGLDAYFSIGGKTSYPISSIKQQEGVWLLPASRLLRPYAIRELFLNDKKIDRIKDEMTLAARNKECYHLWWHPHNFGGNPAKNMEGLDEILRHYAYLKNKYGMTSLNMSEIATRLENG
ncbi:MAG: polysaccharide deacetylase [Bacteroidota bacterium]